MELVDFILKRILRLDEYYVFKITTTVYKRGEASKIIMNTEVFLFINEKQKTDEILV